MAEKQETARPQPTYTKTTAAEVLVGSAAALNSNQRAPLAVPAIAHYEPNSAEVTDLIKRADAHPLGLEFLHEGMLDAVAATFSVHAFVVEQARSARTTP